MTGPLQLILALYGAGTLLTAPVWYRGTFWNAVLERLLAFSSSVLEARSAAQLMRCHNSNFYQPLS